MRASRFTALIFSALALTACDAGFKGVALQSSVDEQVLPLHDGTLIQPGSKARTVTVKWAANPEQAVNAQGGGYKILWNKKGAAMVSTKQVAFQSGAQAPTTATLTLDPGIYEVQVVAYSSLNTGSAPSAKMTVTVPEAQ